MKPILCITTPYPREMQLDEMSELASSAGYVLLVITGRNESAKVLSPKRMKRADYAACINAAKSLLKMIP